MLKKAIVGLLSVGVLWCFIEIIPHGSYQVPQRPRHVHRDYVYRCWNVKHRHQGRHDRGYYKVERKCRWIQEGRYEYD